MRVLSQEQEPVNSYFPWALGLAFISSHLKDWTEAYLTGNFLTLGPIDSRQTTARE